MDFLNNFFKCFVCLFQRKCPFAPLELGRPGQQVPFYVNGSGFLKSNNYNLNCIIWTSWIHILLKIAEKNIPEPYVQGVMSSRRRKFTVIKTKHLISKSLKPFGNHTLSPWENLKIRQPVEAQVKPKWILSLEPYQDR